MSKPKKPKKPKKKKVRLDVYDVPLLLMFKDELRQKGWVTVSTQPMLQERPIPGEEVGEVFFGHTPLVGFYKYRNTIKILNLSKPTSPGMVEKLMTVGIFPHNVQVATRYDVSKSPAEVNAVVIQHSLQWMDFVRQL